MSSHFSGRRRNFVWPRRHHHQHWDDRRGLVARRVQRCLRPFPSQLCGGSAVMTMMTRLPVLLQKRGGRRFQIRFQILSFSHLGLFFFSSLFYFFPPSLRVILVFRHNARCLSSSQLFFFFSPIYSVIFKSETKWRTGYLTEYSA